MQTAFADRSVPVMRPARLTHPARCNAASSAPQASPAVTAPPSSDTPLSMWSGGRWAAPKRRPMQMVEVPEGCVALNFILKKETHYGQRVMLVGSCQELGAWKLTAGLPLRWSEEHKWSITVPIPAGTSLEYKFVLTDSEAPPLWESCLNRSLAVGSAAAMCMYGAWNEPLVAAAVPPPRPVEVLPQPTVIAAELKKPDVAAASVSKAPAQTAVAAAEPEAAEAKPAAPAAKPVAVPKQPLKEIKISAEAEAAVRDIIDVADQADGDAGSVVGVVELGAAAASMAGGIIKGKAAAKGGRRQRKASKTNATKSKK